MQWIVPVTMALIGSTDALIRFGCSQLVVERLDPLVNPGQIPSSHIHQVVGGNTFNITMDPKNTISDLATCTTCQFSEDFSNYWTAAMYFRAKNGTYKRVQQIGNAGFEGQTGGMTIYYMQDALFDPTQTDKVTAFQKGFRMLTGNPTFTTLDQAKQFRQLTYTCLQTIDTRNDEILTFPTAPCPAGIMVSLRFPTCWDGVNLDSPDHTSHVSYPESGTFESGGPCPASHPVRLPQLMFETIFDTRPFNDQSLWDNGQQPFVWSFNDDIGYGTHGDYVFGWQGDALQRAMNSSCYVTCPTLKTQTIDQQNQCSMKAVVDENVDEWLTTLPGTIMKRSAKFLQ